MRLTVRTDKRLIKFLALAEVQRGQIVAMAVDIMPICGLCTSASAKNLKSRADFCTMPSSTVLDQVVFISEHHSLHAISGIDFLKNVGDMRFHRR